MNPSKRRFIRRAIVTAAAAGVALASPVVAVADDSDAIEASAIDQIPDPPSVQVPTTERLVIELIIEGDPPTDPTDLPSDAQTEEAPGDDEATTATEPPSDEPSADAAENATEAAEAPAVAAMDTELIDAGPTSVFEEMEAGSEGKTGATGDEHPGATGDEHPGATGDEHTGATGDEHTGGPGTGGSGTGTPYVMTFEVSWQFSDGSTISVLDDVLPTDWRSMFDLAAASETGGGHTTTSGSDTGDEHKTTARCTYPPGSTDLVCEFENPGKHSSVTDGMIVPAKKTAKYYVTLPWPTSGWTIDGANADSYSARDLCPRGGGGHDRGETHEVAAPEESGFICVHSVVVRKSAASPEPPAVEPPAQDPPASEVPAAAPPQSPTPPAVEVLPTTATPRTLPATGNTATTTLMVGAIILALGGCLSVLARRRNELELS